MGSFNVGPPDNPLAPPSQSSPLMPPPGPPPPPSPALGFQVWASDPMNALKVQPSMTSPSAPLQPNHPSNAGMMASAQPPQNPSALAPPGFQAPQQTPLTSTLSPQAAPAMPKPQTQEQDMQN